MIPQILTKNHLFQAMAQIDGESVPKSRCSVHYDLVVAGKKYPPKYVISLATRIATGIELSPSEFNAVEAKNYFRGKGYDVIDRRSAVATLAVIVNEDEESAFAEGTAKYRLHRLLERDTKLAKKAKAKRLADTGKLECDVCSVNFFLKYGPLGEGFIEAHHTTPVSVLDGKVKTKLSDFALVCSNCHRMLHKGSKLRTLHELKQIVDECAIKNAQATSPD